VPVLRALPALGGVEGELRVLHGRDDRPLEAIIYLTREGATALAWTRERTTVVWRDRRFVPALVAVAPGRDLQIENEGSIHHRLFAVTADGSLDVDLPPEDATRMPPLEPGFLRFYCRLHERESLSVLVPPTPYFARADEAGHFAIGRLPPGHWRLNVWSEVAAGPVRPVDVGWLGPAHADVFLDARLFRAP
jgi:plastocyanin